MNIIDVLRDLINYLENDENKLRGYLNETIHQRELDMISFLVDELDEKGFLLKKVDEVNKNLFNSINAVKIISQSGYSRLNYVMAYFLVNFMENLM